MKAFLEYILASLWNGTVVRENHSHQGSGLDLGAMVIDGAPVKTRFLVSQIRRTHHLAVLGRTGMGKSSLLKYCSQQDIREDRGFIHFDLHGDTTPHLLRLIAQEEQRRHQDLSGRVIIINPADPLSSVGLNLLEQKAGLDRFVQIADFAQILKQRWHLESFGARTEELLRNSLFVLAQNNLTLLELAPLLTNTAFRSACLGQVEHPEVRAYFEERYGKASEAMQAAFRDAVLNKISAFTADPHFRHILGQQRSSFSLSDAIDGGYWVILNLEKGRLGEQAATLGSLLLAKVKSALFSRKRRDSIFTLYCDEIQNLVAYQGDLDTLLSEARKFGISVCSANQFLDQYPAQMRSAVLAVGTHILFQLSSVDAERMAAALDGGKALGELLKNLPQRHMVVKSGSAPWREVVVPGIERPRIDAVDLYERCSRRWAKKRTEIEREIQLRQAQFTQQQTSRNAREALDGWE